MSDEHSDIGPGEVAVGPTLAGGITPYMRRAADGSIESGVLAPSVSLGDSRCIGYMEVGDELRPGVRAIKQHIRFTCKGPARVASDAYRSGWDAVYGGKGAPS